MIRAQSRTVAALHFERLGKGHKDRFHAIQRLPTAAVPRKGFPPQLSPGADRFIIDVTFLQYLP